MKKFISAITMIVLLVSLLVFTACDPYDANYQPASQEETEAFAQKLSTASETQTQSSSYEMSLEGIMNISLEYPNGTTEQSSTKMKLEGIITITEERSVTYYNYDVDAGSEGSMKLQMWMDFTDQKVYYNCDASVDDTSIQQKYVVNMSALSSLDIPVSAISPSEFEDMLDVSTIIMAMQETDATVSIAGNKCKIESSTALDSIPVDMVIYVILNDDGTIQYKFEMKIDFSLQGMSMSADITAEMKPTRKTATLPSDASSYTSPQ